MMEWNQYCGMDQERALEVMNGNVFIDLRSVYAPGHMRAAGFHYTSVGRA